MGNDQKKCKVLLKDAQKLPLKVKNYIKTDGMPQKHRDIFLPTLCREKRRQNLIIEGTIAFLLSL